MDQNSSDDRSRRTGGRRWLIAVVAATISGMMLGLAGPPLTLWPLLAVALIPVLVVLLDRRTSLPLAIAMTALVGMAQNLTAAAVLQFPLAFAAFLVIALGLFWPLVGLIVQPLARKLAPSTTVLAVAAAFAVVEVLSFTLVPVFGTAQSFGRSLIAWTPGVAVASLTGVAGVVFALVLPQALAGVALSRRSARGLLPGAVAVAATWLVCAGWAGHVASRPDTASVRVAAVGWTYDQLGTPWGSGPSPDRLTAVLTPLLDEAVVGGAELVVAPEAAFRVEAGEHDAFLARASTLASSRDLALVVGYFDAARDVNEAALFDPGGELAAVYRKTHLILGMEDYQAGDGTLVQLPGGHPRGGLPADHVLGALICQDDNFRDLGRAYGRLGVAALAIPTNDWEQVQEFHLQNTRLRAVDSGVAIVRGATNGISAVIDRRGRLLASRDHHAEGPGVVLADLPLRTGTTPYARFGEWFTGCCVLGLLGCAVLARRSRRSQ